MKKTLQVLCMVLFLLGSFQLAHAQTEENPLEVTVRDLNDYSDVTLDGTEDLTSQLYNDGQYVTFTAVVASEPLNSGIRALNSDGTIGSLQFFVTDTTALGSGRDGMSLRMNEGELSSIEGLIFKGDVVTIIGQLGFFGEEAQFDISSITKLGSVNDSGTEFEAYAPLLEPVKIQISDVVAIGNDGSMGVKWENYSKYNNMYVTFTGASVDHRSNSDTGFISGDNSARPNWAVRQGDAATIIYDMSLRFRNDKTPYREGYNYRRETTTTDINGEPGEGPFQPPAIGSLVNISGFLVLDTYDPAGYGGDSDNDGSTSDEAFFKINPMNDGVFWSDNGDGTFTKLTEEDGIANDVEVIGAPPVVDDFTITNTFPEPDEEITITVSAVHQLDDASAGLDSVYIDYSVNGTIAKQLMTNTSGDTYEGTLPGFSDGDIVSLTVKAVDTSGLVGQYPAGGTVNLIISSFSNIEVLQKTSDGGEGPSALAGQGKIGVNIEATVVADEEDGFIIVQDDASMWSGIFLDYGSDVNGENSVAALRRGDVILIESLTIEESFGLTYATDVQFTVTGSTEDITTLYPSISTDELASNSEAYEGMMVTLANVSVDTTQADAPSDFGEFTIKSDGATSAFRVDDNVPSFGSNSNITSQLNENLKSDVSFDLTMAVGYSFGNFKGLLRSYDAFSADNFTYPVRNLNLSAPEDGASVTVDTTIFASWENSVDYDGGEVTYKWFLSEEADTKFNNPLAVVEADEAGAEPTATIDYQTIDGILAELGLSDGDSITAIWSVFVYSQGDSVQVSTINDDNEFVADYNTVNLTRKIVQFDSFIELYTSNVGGFAGEELMVPVYADIEAASTSSVEFEFTNFAELGTYTGVYTDSTTLFDANGWTVSSNFRNDTLLVAAGGADNIDNSGVLFYIGIDISPDIAEGEYYLDLYYAGIDENPSFYFDYFTNPINVSLLMLGDVSMNGEVRAYDASLVLQWLVGNTQLSEAQMINGDVTQDDDLTALDASYILDYVVELVDFPINETPEPSGIAEFGNPVMDNSLSGTIIEVPVMVRDLANLKSLTGTMNLGADWYTKAEFIWSDDFKEFQREFKFTDGDLKFAAAGPLTEIAEGSIGTLRITVESTEMLKDQSVRIAELRWNEAGVQQSVSNVDLNLLITSLETDETPTEFSLGQNYPNPFNPTTTINYSLPEASEVTIRVYNIHGQIVSTLVNGTKQAGQHSAQFNASSLASGVYIYQMRAGSFMEIQKMVLIK